MRNKIMSYHYNEHDGLTRMTIKNKYGRFFAFTIPVDEDFDVANKWTGGRLAEYKCEIQTLKKKYKIMNQRAIGIENAVKNIKSRPNTLSQDSFKMIELFEKQARTARKDANDVKKLYESMEKNYKQYAENEIQAKRKINKNTLTELIEEDLKEPAE